MSQFVVGPEAGDENTGPVTIYDIQEAERSEVRVQALPRLIRQAVHIAWAAGRSEFVVSTLLQIIAAAALRCCCSLENKACKHSSMQCKAVSHSLQSQRMQLSGPQSLNVVFGLSGLTRAAIGVVAVLATLITIEPLLVFMVSIVFLPAWLLASRRGEALWRFSGA